MMTKALLWAGAIVRESVRYVAGLAWLLTIAAICLTGYAWVRWITFP